METFKQEVLTKNMKEVFVPSTFNNGECDNFILEMHYNIIFENANNDTLANIAYPTEYQCSEGAIENKGIFCPDFDLCKDPTIKYNYNFRNKAPRANSTEGRCPNYPWCDENYRFGKDENEVCF